MKALFFLFCFILVMVSFGIAQDDFIFHYDFNQETAGKPPSDPWQPTVAGEVVVEKFPDEIFEKHLWHANFVTIPSVTNEKTSKIDEIW